MVAGPSPPPPKQFCPVGADAPIVAEPLPPKGISTKALHDSLVATFGQPGEDLFTWIGVDHPVWARGVANRLASIRSDCKKLEAEGTTPPT